MVAITVLIQLTRGNRFNERVEVRVMRSFVSCLVCAVLIGTTTIVTAAASGLRTYFSEELPVEITKPQSLSSMDQIVVARVRVLGGPAGLYGFEQSARPGEAFHEDYSAWLQVLAVLRGKRPELERINVTFGSGHSYAQGPTTPRQLQQEYFVAMYEDLSGFHLIGVPIEAAKYTEWQQEIGVFERERVKSLPK